MNEPSEEELAASIERTKIVCARISSVLQGTNEADARAALAAAIAQQCLSNPNPDRAFLESIDAAFAVFREMSNVQYRNQDPGVS